jgi:putative endonuclease
MYLVYILENTEGKHYIGYTSDLKQRIKDHNSTKGRWTKKKGPWRLVYKEAYSTKEEAYSRENQIKRYKGGRAFKLLLDKSNIDGEVFVDGEMSELV